MYKVRLDTLVFKKGIVSSRSQAESYIKLGLVSVDSKIITKSGFFVPDTADIRLNQNTQYVSRAGLKLASVSQALKLNFKDKVVLDVGSSTGGFTDFALKNGAKRVYAVDVGTNQLHPTLRSNPKIELYEQTNILNVRVASPKSNKANITENPNHKTINTKLDIIVIDVSFVSLRELLPHIATYLASQNTQIVAMLKPQFETGGKSKNKGVVKNNKIRREIIKDFEEWVKKSFVIKAKADSDVAGAQGNQERFYLLEVSKSNA